MRAMLWIAASGILATGSAYAGTAPPVGHDDTVRTDAMVEAASQPVVGAFNADQGSQGFGNDLPKTKPEETRPQGNAAAKPIPVSSDPDHPGGLFPWGG
jgi:hypothetical protein